MSQITSAEIGMSQWACLLQASLERKKKASDSILQSE
jgi:hypothetical protein